VTFVTTQLLLVTPIECIDSHDLLACFTGEEAKKLFDDAQRMLSDIIDNGLLHCAGVFGFWRANSVSDDIEIYDDNGSVIATLYGLRQQVVCQPLVISTSIVVTICAYNLLTAYFIAFIFFGIFYCLSLL